MSHASGHTGDVLKPSFLDQLGELVQVADKPTKRLDQLIGFFAGGLHCIRQHQTTKSMVLATILGSLFVQYGVDMLRILV